MGFTCLRCCVASSSTLYMLLERIRKSDPVSWEKISSAKVGKHILVNNISNEEALKKITLMTGEVVIFYPTISSGFQNDVFLDVGYHQRRLHEL